MNYLQWLSSETPTKFWHDSAIPSEIDAAIANGALGVTTNPVLTYKTLQAVPEFWQLLLCKQAAKIFQTICKKETALKRVLRNLLSAISFAQI